MTAPTLAELRKWLNYLKEHYSEFHKWTYADDKKFDGLLSLIDAQEKQNANTK